MNKSGRTPNNHAGERFGNLVALRYAAPAQWECLCDCGAVVVCKTYNLMNGHTRSCGCLRKALPVKHGHARNNKPTRTWRAWCDMKRRCENRNRADYRLYGGRGITVCDRWKVFENFLADMGEKPEGRTLGRINNNGNYEPGNCRWETAFEQGGNKRNNHLVSVSGITRTVSAWARLLPADPDAIFTRIRRGWSGREAVTIPLGGRRMCRV